MTPIPTFLVLAAIIALTLLFFYSALMRIQVALLRNKLTESYHKRAETTRFFDIFARNISEMGELDNWMNVTARYVGDLVGAQSVCIFSEEDEGFLRASGVYGLFPPLTSATKADYVMTKPKYILETLRRDKIKYGDGFIGGIAGRREEMFVPDCAADPHFAGLNTGSVQMQTFMAVTLVNKGKVEGVMCAVNSKNEFRPFTPEQFGRFKYIASQVVMAQNIVRVYSELSQQQRINQELSFARRLQMSLMPSEFPKWGKFVISGFTRPSKEVSGDFYDFVKIDDDRMLVVIGDACGKGIPACMIMAMTRAFIRSNIERFISLKDLMIELNENLFRDTIDERYITLGACLLNKKEATIEYARAGHTPFIVYLHKHTRNINPDGSALGLLPSDLSDFDTICTEVVPNSAFVMYTDGITETSNDKDELYGIDRLGTVFRELCLTEKYSPQEIIDGIMKSVDDFSDIKSEQDDDQTMVVIKYM